MIKIENNVYYLTAGNACYIFTASSHGELLHRYYGRRIEPEDELGTLGSVPDAMREFFMPGFDGRFEIKRQELLEEKPPADVPMLDGGKTLALALADDSGIRADIFITPYARGGFTRRTIITNNGNSAVTIPAGCSVTGLAGEYDAVTVGTDGKLAVGEYTARTRTADRFAAVAEHGADEAHGRVYGFACVFGDGRIDVRRADDGIYVMCAAREVRLMPGETLCLPEVLTVFSDSGYGGMSRAFHDIIRENSGNRSSERKPVVLFCPTLEAKDMCRAASAALELGLDVFCVNADGVGHDGLKKIAAEAKRVGIKLGIKVCVSAVKKGSVLCGKSGIVPVSADKYAVGDSRAFALALEKLIDEFDIEYIMLDIPEPDIEKFAYAMYSLRREMQKRFGELVVEWGAVAANMQYAQSLVYPYGMTRIVADNSVASLKTAFDRATLGCLGYAFNPFELSDDIKRAVRAQVFSYQDDAPTVLGGDLYRLNAYDRAVVSKDKSKAYAVCLMTADRSDDTVRFVGLDEHNIYHVREKDKAFSGAALMYCGIKLAGVRDGDTVTFHLRQVADFY